MSIKSFIVGSGVALVAALTPVAQAAVVYSASFQGATFNITTVDSDTFTFQILGANALTGDWLGANYLAAFDFKGLGIDFSAPGIGATAFYESIGPSINGVNAQLNANLCNTSVGETGSICFDPIPNIGVAANMLFTIDITGGATLDFASAGPHLQIMWTKDLDRTDCKTTGPDHVETCNDSKLGSLYSQDIGLSSSSSSSTSSSGLASSSGDIPEPNSSVLALLGLGLVGATFRLRRKAPNA